MSRKRPGDIRQMQIDWKGVQNTPPVGPSAELPQETIAIDSPLQGEPVQEDHRPLLRLRWDFRTRFPQVLPDLVGEGVISEEDNLPESIEAIHQEHGGKMLGALADLDAAIEKRRRSSQPVRPDSDSLPSRLQRWYESLLGVYEEWFGQQAAEAFDKAVRAWHARIEVVVDRDTAPCSIVSVTKNIHPVAQPPAEPQEPPPLVSEVAASPVRSAIPLRGVPASSKNRVSSNMPVPKPLPSAIAAGHFGTDERGQPIHPSADEVYDITRNHADRLIEWIESLPASGNSRSSTLEAQIQADIAKYAEDFGEPAARRLEAYCRRQAGVLTERNDVPAPRSR